MRAVVAVVGDLGRSPRIQYQALALARAGVQVDLVGSAGSACLPDLEAQPSLRTHRLPAPPFEERDPSRPLGFALRSAARLLHQTVTFGAALWRLTRGADLLLVQDPPALPTLPLARLAARASGARLVIDWHNLSASVLRAKRGRESAATRLLAAVERRGARGADANLCVSQVLADRVHRELGASEVVVLPDLPHPRFALAPLEPGAAARTRSELDLPAGAGPLLVCPTSWSHDEDVSLLLHALDAWDAGPEGRPVLEVVITGRGPGREACERELASRSWKRSHVYTRWFSHGDYARLLACADLGLCLHRSSSGADLPMKLADFAGAGLPACALDYGAVLDEAPAPGATLRFASADELAACWLTLFGPGGTLPALRRAAAAPRESWEDAWRRLAREPLGLGRVTP